VIQDDPTESAEKKDKQSAQTASEERVNSPAAKPEEKPPQAVIPPPKPPENLGTDTRTENDKTKHNCHNEISVKVIKEDTLSFFERRSLTLAWVTLIVLILTFVIFALQLNESRKQTWIFRRQVDQATKDAQLTRDQTDTQIQIAKDQFIADQRPYVWMQDPPSDWIVLLPSKTGQPT
jgi:beta-lactamase regulating signal transducer with metallopeptidase domain